jgi:GNAT superfamily N-acetyltransferase
MNYRIATTSDVSALTKMRWEHINEYGEQPEYSWDIFQEACNKFYQESIETGAWDNICAHVCIQIIHKIPSPVEISGTWGYATNVYTKPEHRNQGIGGTLMDYVQKWAQDQGLELLLLWASEKSVEFYKRNKFKFNSRIMEYKIKEDECSQSGSNDEKL